MNNPGEVTQILSALKAGQSGAQDRLFEAVYPELRRIAGRCLSRENRGHVLQSRALVSEAYFQLTGQMDKDWQNRKHFYYVAALVMRRVLIDYARKDRAKKNNGGQQVELTDALAITEARLDEVLAIDQALERLTEFDGRAARVVELRFFGGLSEDEVADLLGVAKRTVRRDWEAAKAWLHSELSAKALAAAG